uniref:CCHC-type domain-containing protein n=1 Tax=Brassica oleracea var. oleracea TaxID=109376 RepID=A0A0D3ED10_BRAOL
MTKSLTNKLLLKQRLFALRMQEDAALILLVSLPNSFENFVQSFIVGKDTVRLEEVRSALHSRGLRHKASSSGTDNQASGLFVSGVKGHGKKRKSKDRKSFPRGPKPTDTCNYCKEKGHWKSDCPKKKKEQQSGSAAVAEDEAKSDSDIALVVHGHTHSSDVTSGPLGRMARWGIWSAWTSTLKDIRFERTSGPLGHLIRKDIWSVGESGPLGYSADDERLALVEHLAVKGRLVRHSNTSGPKGHLRQRER